TTPEADDLQAIAGAMVEQGCKNLVMEVSSHAIDQGRNELKDKVGALAGIGGGAKLMATGAAAGNHAQDAMSALGNLGFKPGEAGSAVALAVEELGPDATLDALVRLALKRASR
ncbi:MAG: hypothetical protein NTU75_10205, partial [Sphingomonadales bacterium]|nr:hypothetical protein [Sphingomonadales bacterium]